MINGTEIRQNTSNCRLIGHKSLVEYSNNNCKSVKWRHPSMSTPNQTLSSVTEMMMRCQENCFLYLFPSCIKQQVSTAQNSMELYELITILARATTYQICYCEYDLIWLHEQLVITDKRTWNCIRMQMKRKPKQASITNASCWYHAHPVIINTQSSLPFCLDSRTLRACIIWWMAIEW